MTTDLILTMYFQGLYPTAEFNKIDLCSRNFYLDAADFYSKKASEKQRLQIISGIKYLFFGVKLIDEFEYIGKAWEQANTLMILREAIFKGPINLYNAFRIEVGNILENRKNNIISKNEKKIKSLEEENTRNKMLITGLNNLIIKETSKYKNKDDGFSDLKTFSQSAYTKIQLNTIRERLIKENITDRISESDFFYLFNGNPITESMKTLKWEKSLPLAHTFLKRFVYTNTNFNMIQVNECIKFKNGKKLDSNNISTSQYRHGDILNPILQF